MEAKRTAVAVSLAGVEEASMGDWVASPQNLAARAFHEVVRSWRRTGTDAVAQGSGSAQPLSRRDRSCRLSCTCRSASPFSQLLIHPQSGSRSARHVPLTGYPSLHWRDQRGINVHNLGRRDLRLQASRDRALEDSHDRSSTRSTPASTCSSGMSCLSEPIINSSS
jgi:hypothetical protein